MRRYDPTIRKMNISVTQPEQSIQERTSHMSNRSAIPVMGTDFTVDGKALMMAQ